ncbi:hypothetical protein [Agromyces italicus]|uniref:hypothetical protein n=1 Tax=Agromyces italicus TaxID=279572 RepID=UPI0003B35C9B|nr:hypothetical protein [Agromyces italicus]
MTISQEQFDDVLGRTALAALFYLPEVTVEDGHYRIHEDVAHCLEPVAELDSHAIQHLREVIARTIADPTAHRSELLALVFELAPPPTTE